MSFVPYLVGAAMVLGSFLLGALFGCGAGIKEERKRCLRLVKDHLCSECYSRHCFLRLASQIKMEVVNDEPRS